MSYTNLKIQNFAHRADGAKDTDMEEQQEDKDGPQGLPVKLRMRASVATALGAAAAQAKILADQEEREMEQLAAPLIDQQFGCNL
ncbi:hypothetical protein AXX17_ATUG02440 (mitochondrion) [Arabidopsis thaliana]|uniref:SMARCC C-terminal domain-containing protein n=2 Tax=Arabidopsis thaliana TaxID=3702 RepID=A0A178U6G9_ARATH|nr:hypothetical protein AXX17_ATUG02440 [Arabidopsis thaliana]